MPPGGADECASGVRAGIPEQDAPQLPQHLRTSFTTATTSQGFTNMAYNTEHYVQSGEPLHEFLRSFWQRQVDAAEEEVPDYRHPPLPLARIKKVMKSDPDVKVCYHITMR